MPHRDVQEGEDVVIRARIVGCRTSAEIVDFPNMAVTVELSDGDLAYLYGQAIEVCSDAFRVRRYDNGQVRWYPANECAKVEDIGRLLPRRERAPLTAS